jgi:hypothetical protein
VCERAVATALKRLRELGILNWVRRCAQSWQDGRFVLEQETNLRRAASDAVAGRQQNRRRLCGAPGAIPRPCRPRSAASSLADRACMAGVAGGSFIAIMLLVGDPAIVSQASGRSPEAADGGMHDTNCRAVRPANISLDKTDRIMVSAASI